MALYLNDDLEYKVQDYSVKGDFQDVERHNEDDEVADDAQVKTDTSALEYRKGKDIQGIPWEMLNHSRKKYREMRLKQYKNYENLPRSENELDKECRMVESGHKFYDFQFNTRLVKSTIVHFQIVIIGIYGIPNLFFLWALGHSYSLTKSATAVYF